MDIYPRYSEVPRDAVDPSYVESFDDMTLAKSFFEKYGFVVLRDVYDTESCEISRRAMWDVIEKKNPDFDRLVSSISSR